MKRDKKYENWFLNKRTSKVEWSELVSVTWHLHGALEILRPRFAQSSQRVACDKAIARIPYDHDHRATTMPPRLGSSGRLRDKNSLHRLIVILETVVSLFLPLCSSIFLLSFYPALVATTGFIVYNSSRIKRSTLSSTMQLVVGNYKTEVKKKASFLLPPC